MENKTGIDPRLIFILFIIAFVALSFFIQNLFSKGQFIGVAAIILSIAWLALLVLCSVSFFYDYFGIFEQLIILVPFLDLPNLLSGLYERSVVSSYEIDDAIFRVNFRNGSLREYFLTDIRVVRSGNLQGSKSLFSMKIGKTWRPFIFEKDGALTCSKELRKQIGRLKNR